MKAAFIFLWQMCQKLLKNRPSLMGLGQGVVLAPAFGKGPRARVRIFPLVMLFACVCNPDKGKEKKIDPQPEKKPTLPTSPELSQNEIIQLLVEGFKVSQEVGRLDMSVLTQEPHPFGAPRQKYLAGWLENKIKEARWSVLSQSFESNVPNPEAPDKPGAPITLKRQGQNVIAAGGVVKAAPCVVALASHYDTKIVEGTSYVGANDSGSSTLALLQIMSDLSGRGTEILEKAGANSPLVCDIALIWFDGEEAVLPGWGDGLITHPARIVDNTYGSRDLAGRMSTCTYLQTKAMCLPADLGGRPLVALIVLDMIGSPQLKLVKDSFSSPWMVKHFIKVSGKLGLESILEQTSRGIEDDHIAFVKKGVSALDIIDFSNLTYWHTQGDYADKISYDSIEKASKIGLALALDIATRPKDFLALAEEFIGNQ